MSTTQPPYTPGQRHALTLAPGVVLWLRYIPPTGAAGFRMGSRYEEAGSDWPQRTEQPIHRVRLAAGYWLGETVVTQAQFAVWTAATGEQHENRYPGRPNHPAEGLDWWHAVKFGAWLSEQEALRPAADKQFPASTAPLLACLPTEAEWEHACRAESETEFYNGDGEAALAEVGWYAGNSGQETHDVAEHVGGREERHPWGLRGMHGNVWEWCHDYWGEGLDKLRPIYRRAVDGDGDPCAAERAADYERGLEAMLENRQLRVMRGGWWDGAPRYCRSAYRKWGRPDYGNGLRGFRLCLAPGPAEPNRKTEQEEAEAARGAGDGGRGTSPKSRATSAAGAGVKSPEMPDLTKARLPRPKKFS
jgi:formylglycine-generating enzyme required for sulfatase activity